MKTTVLIATCTAIGVAAGWFLKPENEAAPSETATPTVSSRAKSSTNTEKTTRNDRSVVSSRRNGQSDSDNTDARATRALSSGKQYQERFMKMLAKRQNAKIDARIAKLVAQLNLTPEQEAALRKALEEKNSSSTSGEFSPFSMAGQTGDASVDEALKDILTDEQKEEHVDLKERELANKVESRALKQLAKLSDLDMTQEQKDAVYDILYQQAEKTTGEASPMHDSISAITSGLGVDIDPDDLGLGFSVGAEMYQSAREGEQDKPQDMSALIKERQQKVIDEKVQALSPVLNDSQLEQYRSSLELKSSGLFGSFLQGDDQDDE